MSSSQSSLSSASDAAPGPRDASTPLDEVVRDRVAASSRDSAQDAWLAGLKDIACSLTIQIGTGTLTVKQVLELGPPAILAMEQAAGEDLQLIANGVLLARGETVIVEDSTALRVTEIVGAAGDDPVVDE